MALELQIQQQQMSQTNQEMQIDTQNSQQPIIDNILAEHNLTLDKLLRFPPETQQEILESLTNEN